MNAEPLHIPFEEFARDLDHVFDDVRARNQVVLVERDGEIYRLEKQDIWQGYDPEKVRAALRASAGALQGVDRDELLADIRAQREQAEGRFA